MDFDFARAAGAFGISMLGSFFTGAAQKHRTPLPNKLIPAVNAAVFGGSTAAATGGEPSTTIGGIAGALTASLLFSGFKAIRR